MIKTVLLKQLLRAFEEIKYGSLAVTTPDGKVYAFHGDFPGQNATLTFKTWQAIENLIFKGDVGFGHDYALGHWSTENLAALLTLGLHNKEPFQSVVMGKKIFQTLEFLSYLFKRNTIQGSKKNIHAHYDLGNDFYKLWLDPSMTYSSGIFSQRTETLLEAQNNKYDRILDHLNHRSGSLLEIGCGWGGFAKRALEKDDFDYKGITISNAQKAYAKNVLDGAGKVVLEDYRHQEGKFDSIVSIEMFEAVGEQYWKGYFAKIKQLLEKSGSALIQTITINEKDFPRYRRGSDFIRSYIFPGGMLPSLSRFSFLAQKCGLKVQDVFHFGESYAQTLRHWLDNFDKISNEVRLQGFDDHLIRIWRFYLASCIASFSTEHTDVVQVKLAHV